MGVQGKMQYPPKTGGHPVSAMGMLSRDNGNAARRQRNAGAGGILICDGLTCRGGHSQSMGDSDEIVA
jgi:hypothetical protein